MKYFILIFAGFFGTQLLAGVQLQERQRQISLIQEYETNYKLVRDQFYLGDKGLVATIQPWTTATVVWIEKWDKIWLEVEKIKAPNVDPAVIQALESLVRDQEFEKKRLLKEANEFVLRADRVQTILYSKTPPRTVGELYGEKIDKLIEANNNLNSHISAIEKSLLAKADRLKYISGFANEKLEAFLTNAKINNPSSAEIVQKVQSLLKLSTRTEPMVLDILKISEEMRLDLSFGKVFHAQAKLAQLKTTFATYRTQISLETGVNDADKAEALGRMQSLVNDAESHYSSVDPAQHPYMVMEYIATYAAPEVRYECSRNKPAANCLLAEWLHRIKAEKIASFPVYKLKALEYAWDAAQKGRPVDAKLQEEIGGVK